MKKIKRYYTSTLIKKREVPDTVNRAIQDDLNLYNHMKMKWFVHPALSHVAMKKEYAVSDYFVTSVEGTVKGIRSSQKELLSDYIKDVRSNLAEMEKNWSI